MPLLETVAAVVAEPGPTRHGEAAPAASVRGEGPFRASRGPSGHFASPSCSPTERPRWARKAPRRKRKAEPQHPGPTKRRRPGASAEAAAPGLREDPAG